MFLRLEDLVVHNLNDKHKPGRRLDWESVAGCWVLRPPAEASQAVVVFVGDVFLGTTPEIAHEFLVLFPESGDVLMVLYTMSAGAAPELSYKLMLESLAARNVTVRKFGSSCLSNQCTQRACIAYMSAPADCCRAVCHTL